MNVNPFEVLRLDPSATEEEIVRRAGQLRQRAGAEELLALRQAVQALTGRPEERELHALLSPPRPCYSWPALERLAAITSACSASGPMLNLSRLSMRMHKDLQPTLARLVRACSPI